MQDLSAMRFDGYYVSVFATLWHGNNEYPHQECSQCNLLFVCNLLLKNLLLFSIDQALWNFRR